MSVAERFAKAAQSAPDTFETWLASQPAEDQAEYSRYAPDTRVSHRDFLAIVKEAGARVGRDKLTAWRKANGFPRG